MDAKTLENMLVEFAVKTLKFLQKQPNSVIFLPLKNQMVRSCTSPALNYAEARGAESLKDFIHKVKIVLKELRETNVSFRILQGIMPETSKELDELISTSNHLIAIFVKSANTLQNKQKPKNLKV
jgi:four helix bundle protein